MLRARLLLACVRVRAWLRWPGRGRLALSPSLSTPPHPTQQQQNLHTLTHTHHTSHSLLCFFGIYLGIVNNGSWRRFVRFNGAQAVLLDILLILPRLLESLVTPPTAGWGLQAYISAQNTVWLFVTACVLYGVGASLLGQTARIPFVADAADQQVR